MNQTNFILYTLLRLPIWDSSQVRAGPFILSQRPEERPSKNNRNRAIKGSLWTATLTVPQSQPDKER